MNPFTHKILNILDLEIILNGSNRGKVNLNFDVNFFKFGSKLLRYSFSKLKHLFLNVQKYVKN